MSPKPTSSRMPTSNRADSTSASGVGPPCLARISFWSEPALTPTRMGMPRACASWAISLTLSCFLMLPGLMRTPAQPASMAAMAYFHWKWMSATTGMVDLAAIAGRAAASSVSGTATRTMSQPVAASSAICCRVPLMSAVLVMVIDWTLMGAPSPTATRPTLIRRERRRPTPAARSVNSSGKATRGSLSERVGDGVGDVEPDQAHRQHHQQAHDQGGHRHDLAQVDLAPGHHLPQYEGQVAAVHRGQGQEVEHPDDDVELDQDGDEDRPLVVGHRLAGQAGDADDADGAAAVAHLPAAPGAGRDRLGGADPVGQPGDEAAQALDGGHGGVPEQLDRLGEGREHAGAPGLLAGLEAEEPAAVLLDRGHGGGPPLAVAHVLDRDGLAALVLEDSPELLERLHRGAGHGHDLVAGRQAAGLGRAGRPRVQRDGAVDRGRGLAGADADGHQHHPDEQDGHDEVGERPGGEHDRPLPGRLVAELPLRRGRGRRRLVGRAVILQEVAVVLVRAHAGDLAEAAQGEGLDAVLGLALPERPDGRAEAEEEALDLHPEELGGREVPAFVQEDGQHEGENEERDAEHAGHRFPREVIRSSTSVRARSRDHRSVASTASRSRTAGGWCRSRISATTSAMPGNGSRPARKAATASSLAALRAAGAVAPSRPARTARSNRGKVARSSGWNSRVVARAQSIRPTGRSSRSGQPRARPIGSRMSGMESWATVEPSHHSTMAWTMLWGWTTTSMRSYGTSNSRWASITSRPLFIRVAELTVITGPIAQVGWASAWAGVTSASSAAERPRNGPPEAVTTSRATSSGRPARRHWASPECSESTGTIWPGLAMEVTSSPPTIRLSLLARASRRPASRAPRG